MKLFTPNTPNRVVPQPTFCIYIYIHIKMEKSSNTMTMEKSSNTEKLFITTENRCTVQMRNVSLQIARKSAPDWKTSHKISSSQKIQKSICTKWKVTSQRAKDEHDFLRTTKDWPCIIWLVVSNIFHFPFHILHGMSSFPLTNSYFSEG